MKEAIWHIIETFPIIGLLLNILILLILPANIIFGLVRSIKRKNKITIFIFSFLSFCYFIFFAYFLLSIYSFIYVQRASHLEFQTEMEQTHYYTIKEIDSELDVDATDTDFPIVKINDGICIGGDYVKSFKFYIKPDYRITGFVFYFGFSEVPVNYEFVPGHSYEINFEKIQKEYTLKDIGVFYYFKEDPEQNEIWTDEMENGINCLFIK